MQNPYHRVSRQIQLSAKKLATTVTGLAEVQGRLRRQRRHDWNPFCLHHASSDYNQCVVALVLMISLRLTTVYSTQVIVARIVVAHVASEDGDESGGGGISSDGVVFGLWYMREEPRYSFSPSCHMVLWCRARQQGDTNHRSDDEDKI